MGSSHSRPVKQTATQPMVLIPLYIYPLEGAWEPLFTLARACPKVLFVAVVNPCNGPGVESLPDASYTAAIRTMNEIPNIMPVGYVHCTYGARPLDSIIKDVDIYRGWNDNFRIDGVFIDETPSDPNTASYLKSVADHTRSTWRETLGRSAHVVYNPGVVVDRLFFDDADSVVVFEQSEQHWKTPAIQKSMEQLPPDLRSKAVVIVHTLSGDHVARLTREIRGIGLGGLHFTDEVGGGYTKWPVMWTDVAQELGGEDSS
ncbi:Spherulation-specific family 4 [Thelonectria olida]|uniref:Spherulation-specific family 4 n=1 Tax=Thelonectria olida TaxID=1576542 RepID=A0A9P8WDS9_9HYPO|nr:Spherulation-specific family 4 [Thelonectria olida]